MKLVPLVENDEMTSSMMSRVLGGQSILLPTLTVTPNQNMDDGDDSDIESPNSDESGDEGAKP